MLKKILYNLIRILLTGGCIYLAVSMINFSDKVEDGKVVEEGFLTLFSRIDKFIYVVSLGALIIPILVISFRWWLILRSQHIAVSYPKSFVISYTGIFFNNFLPGILGGEVVKAVITASGTEKKAGAVGTVILDHLIGLASMIILAVVVVSASMLYVESGANLIEPAVIIYCLFGGGVMLYAIYFSRVLRSSNFFSKVKGIVPFKNTIAEVDGVMKSVNNSRVLLLQCVLLSLVCQIVTILINFGFVNALHIEDIKLYHLFIFYPIFWIINALPISFGGWGVGEVAFAHFFLLIGVPPNEAIALSVLYRLSHIIISIPGGILFALGFTRTDKNEIEYKAAHKYSFRHRQQILDSNTCGCFYCLAIYPPIEIRDWVDENECKIGQTALCPKCGIDSVIGDKSGIPITYEFLRGMKEVWFNRVS